LYYGFAGEFELALGTELLLFAEPLLVPYWSLVPPLLQPAKINAAAAPRIKISFFITSPGISLLPTVPET
jgi:hypothetical protein